MAAALSDLTLKFENLETFLSELSDVPEVKAGIASVGDAAAYALVWEWGNTRQRKAGPKTVKGTNPDGKMVWLSSQAPFGYIRIHEPEYWEVIEEEMAKLDLNRANTTEAVVSQLRTVAKNVTKKIKIILQDAAPVDSGQLRNSFQEVASGDRILDQDTDDYYTTLLLEEK